MSAASIRAPAAEREAAPVKGSGRGLLLQRKCACGSGAGASGECDSCAAKALLQRRGTAQGETAHVPWPSSVTDTLARPGKPLDAPTRSFMEERFGGTHFGGVQVHDDSAAAASAHDVDAQAYTVGQHIVFGEGQYQPHSEPGRHLLAHELAHTVQQQGLQRTGTSPVADYGPEYHRLEAEADQVAERVMQGGAPVHAGLQQAGGVRLSRKAPPAPDGKEDKPKFTTEYHTTTYNRQLSLSTDQQPVAVKDKVSKTQADYEVQTLMLPPQKGPDAEALYNRQAKAGALKARFQITPSKLGIIKEARDVTDKLKRTWLTTTSYTLGAKADARWKDVGGNSTFPKPPLGPSCEVDHIQELQVGGNNAAGNLQLLDKVDNGPSGVMIYQQVEYLAVAALEDASALLGGSRPSTLTLTFHGAKMEGAPITDACYQLGKRFADPSVTAASDKPTVDVHISAAGKPYILKLSADKTTSIPLTGANAPIATAIKGLTLLSYERDPKGKGHDKIVAVMDAEAIKAKPGTKSTKLSLVIGPDGVLQLPAGKLASPVKADFGKLSPISFTSLTVNEAGVTATGTIKPTLPLLPVLDVVLDPQGFRVGKALDPATIKPPFPGFKVTQASIMMELAPNFKPTGKLAFEFGATKKVADLTLTASADDAGLVLTGDLFIYIPGVEQAKGNVTYQAGQWSGGAHIEASQLKMPFVKGGAIDVGLKLGKLEAGGSVNLELPGNNEATLEVFFIKDQWLFKGRGRIVTKSKYLKPIEARILVQDDLFRATGSAGIAFSGLDGQVDATYEKKGEAEKVYGKGSIKIEKGKAKGSIDVELHPNQTLTGKGKLSYEIKKDMVAAADITVDEKQKITFAGSLSFPDIPLFPRFPKDETPKDLFSASGSIPIPGASIGPIGLKVELYGGLGYYYYVGPGVLTGIKATVNFSPFEPDPDFAFGLKAKASIPVGGGIVGTVGANVVIDALVGKVGGGLKVEAHAGLKGAAELGGEIAYKKGSFSVDASAYIGGKVELGAALKAQVFAEAGVWQLKVKTTKEWTLKETQVNTGLSMGVRMPLHYDSKEGFRMPQLSDIQREPAEFKLDTKAMLGNLFSAAKSQETES